MFFIYFLLEFVLVLVASFTLLSGNKGILLAGIIVTLINYSGNSSVDFWYWEIAILIYMGLIFVIQSVLNKKTDHSRVVKVAGGSVAALFCSGLFLPFLLGLIAWGLLIGIPLVFTYREIPKSVPIQMIFKFIFSIGWLIIGNILY